MNTWANPATRASGTTDVTIGLLVVVAAVIAVIYLIGRWRGR